MTWGCRAVWFRKKYGFDTDCFEKPVGELVVAGDLGLQSGLVLEKNVVLVQTALGSLAGSLWRCPGAAEWLGLSEKM